MTMSYSTMGAGAGVSVTAVECQKQVRSWRLLRYLLELLMPSCNCITSMEENEFTTKQEHYMHQVYCRQPSSSLSNTITGTIFGYRRGKVRFCIQTNSKSINPTLLLELAVPTTILAREMQGGILRIALEGTSFGHHDERSHRSSSSSSLIATPVWLMYCNGRQVGYAIKREASKADTDLLRLMGSVVVGAGVIKGKEHDDDDHNQHDDQIIYLRANFNRVRGSADSESYHLIDPDCNIGQELSIFFYRSE